MGTRNLTVVVYNNEFKVAQYCQWDGYPSGKGVEILDFLLNVELDKFKEKVSAVSFYTDEEMKVIEDMTRNDPNWQRKFPQLSRDTGPDILKFIMEMPEPPKLSNRLMFAADSLFCEWAYVIDLDKMTFEVYIGFNKKPIDEEERFFFLSNKASDGYHPIKLFKTYNLQELPNETTFIKECEESEK